MLYNLKIHFGNILKYTNFISPNSLIVEELVNLPTRFCCGSARLFPVSGLLIVMFRSIPGICGIVSTIRGIVILPMKGEAH